MRLQHQILSAALLVAAAAFPGCGKKAPAAVAKPVPKVTVARPVVREVIGYFEFPGQTQAVGEVEVRARVTGYLMKINFEDGQEVKKGDVLFEIDSRPYQAALERATGDLNRLKALLAQAESDVQRSDHLRPSGAITDDEYEDQVAVLKTHQASIQSAEADVRDAQLNMEFTRVVSPIDGRIGRRRITEGNLVQPGSGESAVLTTIVTVNPIYVTFHIEEPVLLKFQSLDWRLGKDGRPRQIKGLAVPVEIALPNEEGFPHRGVLDFVDNKVNRSTGTICSRAVFDNANQLLTPGLFVRVRVPFGKPRQAMLVSERSIGRDQRQKYLLSVDGEGLVQRREVTLGALQDGLRVVESGIGRDDLVIVSGMQRAKPGTKVAAHFANETADGESEGDAPATAERAAVKQESECEKPGQPEKNDDKTAAEPRREAAG